MKVYGRPEFLLNFNKHMYILLDNINTNEAFPDLTINLVLPIEMPTEHVNSKFPHYNPRTKQIFLPIIEEIEIGLYFRARASTFAHEIGHYLHFIYLPNEKLDDEKWVAWSEMTGHKLNFSRKISDWNGVHYTPSHEDFADEFSFALRGERPFRHKQFYFNLWGQKIKNKEDKRAMIEMWIDNQQYFVNGEKSEMDVEPQIINGRTMVPIRFIAEALGYRVDWNSEERKITIQ